MSQTQNADQLRREECRKLTLTYLALRQELEFRIEAIVRGLTRNYAADFTQEEVKVALTFLEDRGYTKHRPDPMGATPTYQATSDGVLVYERGI